MSTQIQLRRGTAAQNAAFTGAVGEPSYSTDDKLLHIHDGVTPGGNPVVPGVPNSDLTGAYPNPVVSKAGGLNITRALPQLLTAPFTLTGSTLETQAFLFNIPANFLLPNMRVRTWVPMGRVSGTAGFLLLNFYINNVKVGSANHSTSIGSDDPVWEFIVQSAATIIGMPGSDGVQNAGNPVSITYNPAVALPIKITLTNSVSTDSAQVLGYSPEVIGP